VTLRPRIGIARASRTGDYVESVRRAGGAPSLIDAADRAERPWQRIAGVVLTGGPDVDPRLYGQVPVRHHEPAADGRDAFEIELVTRAIERNLPVLAICRGMQVLNVAAGGTLVQHIPDDIPQPLDHQVKTPAWGIAHDVLVQPASALARLLALPSGAAPHRVAVNSRHHQAVKHVAPGLVCVAAATDGVIEAVERPASRFCVAVQWHPENFWRTGEFDGLFRAFVDACR
jgi:putative glutamine amidotransferase